MRDVDDIRHELLLAKAMRSMTRHHGWEQLVAIWKKDRDRLIHAIASNMRTEILELGQWQGEFRVMERLVHLSENTEARIPKLEEELSLALKSAAIPQFNSRREERPVI